MRRHREPWTGAIGQTLVMRRTLFALMLGTLAAGCGGNSANSGGYDPGGQAGYSPCIAITHQPLNDVVLRNPGCYRPDRSVDLSWRRACRDGSYLARMSQADLGRDYWQWATTSDHSWRRSDEVDSAIAYDRAWRKCDQ
jgi:hypothetical protein